MNKKQANDYRELFFGGAKHHKIWTDEARPFTEDELRIVERYRNAAASLTIYKPITFKNGADSWVEKAFQPVTSGVWVYEIR